MNFSLRLPTASSKRLEIIKLYQSITTGVSQCHNTGNEKNSSGAYMILQGDHKKLRRSFCLISPATNMLEGYDIFLLKGGIHSFIWSTKTFLYDMRELRYKQNKIGYHISRISNNGSLIRDFIQISTFYQNQGQIFGDLNSGKPHHPLHSSKNVISTDISHFVLELRWLVYLCLQARMHLCLQVSFPVRVCKRCRYNYQGSKLPKYYLFIFLSGSLALSVVSTTSDHIRHCLYICLHIV